MVAAGVAKPDYPCAAHHIVAGGSPKASTARDILQSFEIDINDARNGVFLPAAKDVANSAYHPSLHTNKYYDTVIQLLSEATSKEDALDIPEYIGTKLQNGTFR